MEIDVFISHHTDSSRHIVEAITNKLESNGIRCWYSCRDISGGVYASSIMDALYSCKIFLLVLNRPASESPHVLNEIEQATSRLGAKENITIVPFHIADDEIAPEAKYYLQRHHWIDAMNPPMYQRIEELTERIISLLGRKGMVSSVGTHQASKDNYRLIGKPPQVREIFVGREELLNRIGQIFSSGKHVVFLEGIGGIGKSELAKQYALQNRSCYDNVLFVTYLSNLEDLLCDPTAIVIEGLVREPEETNAHFFGRKLQILQSLISGRTLLIVDNFDVSSEPNLKQFLQCDCHMIFTSRNAHPGYASIKVEPIADSDLLMNIFEQNYGSSVSEEDKPALYEMFRLVEGHTYTIELLAKQMDASFLSANEMLDILKHKRLQNRLAESVDGRKSQKTAFEHICALFNTSNLTQRNAEY